MFTGQLNQNLVFASLFNMIISQHTFSDNIYTANGSLADRSRVDGTLYGDTKMYIATDVIRSKPWLGDAEASNLLALDRPTNPEVQTVTIDQYRIIPLTVDNYLTKQAFMAEGSFAAFNSQLMAWIRDTKRVYDATLFNSFVGTHVAGMDDNGYGAAQNIQVPVPAEPDGVDDYNTEAYNRIVAQIIAMKMADLIVDLKDTTRKYNDYGYMRSWNPEDLVVVWNAAWVNKITKLDTPTIFHKDGLIDKFAKDVLPARFFGNINTTSGRTSATNTVIRSLVEHDYNTVDPDHLNYKHELHVFPGDLLPVNTDYEAYETYSEDSTVIFKLYHKDSVPFMTAFETGTSFFNPRSLTTNHYLIWGYNDLKSLKNYPFITAKIVQSA